MSSDNDSAGQPAKKRGRYKSYLYDPSVPVPRQTLYSRKKAATCKPRALVNNVFSFFLYRDCLFYWLYLCDSTGQAAERGDQCAAEAAPVLEVMTPGTNNGEDPLATAGDIARGQNQDVFDQAHAPAEQANFNQREPDNSSEILELNQNAAQDLNDTNMHDGGDAADDKVCETNCIPHIPVVI